MVTARQALCLVVTTGALQAFVYRHEVFSDGIAYLDVSDFILAGSIRSAVNGLWSPLYPALLAGARSLAGDRISAEFAVAHAVNFILFLGAAAAMRFFLRTLLNGWPSGPHRDWIFSCSYVLFGWTALDLVRLSKVSPDILVLGVVLLVSRILLRLTASRAGAFVWAGFGAMLAIGYYAKAALFVIGFVWLAVALAPAVRMNQKRAWALAVLVFLGLSAPLAWAVSHKAGRLTFSEAGRLNYLWHVARIPDVHWQGGDSPGTAPVHPTRRISTQPAMFEYASPIGGTYPVWFDPAYWYAGANVEFRISSQLAAIARSAAALGHDLFFSRNALVLVPLVLAAMLAFHTAHRRALLAEASRLTTVIVPAGAGILMYLLVHVETRYVGPFILMTAVCGLAILLHAQPDGPQPMVVLRPVLVVLVTYVGLMGLAYAAMASREVWLRGSGSAQSSEAGSIVRHVRHLGAQENDTVFFIGDAFNRAAWVRLARMRIVGDTPPIEVPQFWVAAILRPAETWNLIRTTGARWAFSDSAPPTEERSAWNAVPGTTFYIRKLRD